MAFPDGWVRRCSLAIQSSSVDADLTNFPVMLTKDTLPSEMFDADGSYPAQSDGGDIRFSSDEEGSTRLSCEIVSFVTDNNPANGRAEIHVKVPSVSSSTNTTIYTWYNTSTTESQPARDAAYGSEDVWSNDFYTVWHVDENSGTEANESTSTENDGTYQGNLPNLSTGVTPVDAQDCDGTGDHVTVTQINQAFSPGFTVDSIIKFDNVTEQNDSVAWGSGSGELSVDSESWYLYFRGGNFYRGSSTLANDTWYCNSVRRDDTNEIDGRTNGADDTGIPDTATNKSGNFEALDALVRTTRGRTAELDGQVAEIRVSSSFRSDAWCDATYETILNASTFVIEGTPESVTGRTPRFGFYLF